jgi:MFS family permease
MNFIDVNTVVPNMIADAGGNAAHLGLLSAIMIGGASFMQLFFAGILMPYPRKKPFLITGIYLRVAALGLLGFFLLGMEKGETAWKVPVILGIMTIFSFSGAFANIAYMDILGKAILPERRKRLLMVKQLISSAGVIVSALLVKVVLSLFAYPLNYSILFFSAGGLLLLGTTGFWMISEPETKLKNHITLFERIGSFKQALVRDRNLRRYLLLINTAGITLSTIPFLILYGKSRFTIDGSLVGTYLLVQMGSAFITNIILNMFNKSQRYKGIIHLFIIVGASAPLLALLLSTSPFTYAFVFIFSGSALAMYQIAAPGVLLEISNDENRAVYSGLAGAGSIMNIIYPIFAGLLIQLIGFHFVFFLTSAIILTGFYAARGIICPRIAHD